MAQDSDCSIANSCTLKVASNRSSHNASTANSRVIAVQAIPGSLPADADVSTVHGAAQCEFAETISYCDVKVIGNGSFGIVYKARLVPDDRVIAIKKVLQDKRYKNREIDIMRIVKHPNIVSLLYFFYSSGDKRKDELYLNLVLEYIPETVYNISRHYARKKQLIPYIYTKLYVYQLLRALSYLRTYGIAHRDVKPQNLLIDPTTSVLKLCDFGSAKKLTPGASNVAYICSRYYRAPELIFGSTLYGCDIDTWSAGCVFGELLLGRPLFPGDSAVNQIVEIIKVLGTPTKEEIVSMNPEYQNANFPQLKAYPWPQVLPRRTPVGGAELINELLVYTPTSRLHPLKACAHSFFDELRAPGFKLPNGQQPPELFYFRVEELRKFPELSRILSPSSAPFPNSSNAFTLTTSFIDKDTTRRKGRASGSVKKGNSEDDMLNI